MFLLRNYRLIVAPRKFDLKTNICPRSEAEKRSCKGKYASFNNTFLRGNYQTDSSETYTLLSLLFTTKFSSACQFKNHVELFSTFLDESHESQCKISKTKQTKKTLLIQFRLFIFYKTACLQKYFHGRVLSIRVFSLDGHYLNNRVFLSRNYRLIFVPRIFDVLKTNICPRSEASRANMLVLRTNFPRGSYQTDSSET